MLLTTALRSQVSLALVTLKETCSFPLPSVFAEPVIATRLQPSAHLLSALFELPSFLLLSEAASVRSASSIARSRSAMASRRAACSARRGAYFSSIRARSRRFAAARRNSKKMSVAASLRSRRSGIVSAQAGYGEWIGWRSRLSPIAVSCPDAFHRVHHRVDRFGRSCCSCCISDVVSSRSLLTPPIASSACTHERSWRTTLPTLAGLQSACLDGGERTLDDRRKRALVNCSTFVCCRGPCQLASCRQQ